MVCAMEATVSGILPSTPCFVLAAQDVMSNLLICDAMFKQENPEFMSPSLLGLYVVLLKMMSIRYLSFTYVYRVIYQVLECINNGINCRYVELFSMQRFSNSPSLSISLVIFFDCIYRCRRAVR